MRIGRLVPQPLLGTGTLLCAVVAVAFAWLHVSRSSLGGSALLVEGLLSLGLMTALVVVQLYPIHMRNNAKLHMGSIPVYLMAALLPLPFAMTAALLGVGAGELLLRKSRGGYYSDVSSQTGRQVLVVGLAAMVAHLPDQGLALHSLPLIGAAIVMWAGDLLTGPLLYCPITGETPWKVIVGVARDGGTLEAAQYLVGILGAVAAREELWTSILLCLPTLLVYSTAKRAKEMHDTTREILERMADTVDLRDPYTGGHSRRVTEYTAGILRELGTRGAERDMIIAAARVHDIGKIGMPDHVLLKAGSLDDEEAAIMREHPERGAELLKRYPDFVRGVDIVRHHHERWDGEGYPYRLRELAIPFGARVIAVADSFDAMTSDRPYRKGMPVAKAVGILREGRGRQWEGAIVDAFIRSIADGLEEPVRPHLELVRPEVAASA